MKSLIALNFVVQELNFFCTEIMMGGGGRGGGEEVGAQNSISLADPPKQSFFFFFFFFKPQSELSRMNFFDLKFSACVSFSNRLS